MILGYARCSTEEQIEGTSLREQQRKVKALAEMRGVDLAYEFVSYVDAGVSGTIPLAERPNGGKLLSDAGKGDIIVSTKLDRLFRSASDALNTADLLKKRGIGLILIDLGVEPVTDSGTAKLFFGMLALMAEFERSRIAERMQDGREAKRARGGCIGTVPYGWRKVGMGKQAQLEPIPEEQAVIERVRSMIEGERASRWKILRQCRKEGILSRSGKPFQANQMQRIMERVRG
jgi:site-specific DNA recombinase